MMVLSTSTISSSSELAAAAVVVVVVVAPSAGLESGLGSSWPGRGTLNIKSLTDRLLRSDSSSTSSVAGLSPLAVVRATRAAIRSASRCLRRFFLRLLVEPGRGCCWPPPEPEPLANAVDPLPLAPAPLPDLLASAAGRSSSLACPVNPPLSLSPSDDSRPRLPIRSASAARSLPFRGRAARAEGKVMAVGTTMRPPEGRKTSWSFGVKMVGETFVYDSTLVPPEEEAGAALDTIGRNVLMPRAGAGADGPDELALTLPSGAAAAAALKGIEPSESDRWVGSAMAIG
jgi:hypothetical protein